MGVWPQPPLRQWRLPAPSALHPAARVALYMMEPFFDGDDSEPLDRGMATPGTDAGRSVTGAESSSTAASGTPPSTTDAVFDEGPPVSEPTTAPSSPLPATAAASVDLPGGMATAVLTPMFASHPQVSTRKILKPSAKKRKYVTAHGFGDTVVEEHLCVKGGRVTQHVALPIRLVESERMIRVAAKEGWLCEMTTAADSDVAAASGFLLTKVG